jgi:hypothetical protein
MTYFVDPSRSAIFDLVYAVSSTIKVVVELRLHTCVEWRVVVGITWPISLVSYLIFEISYIQDEYLTRPDCEVVVGLVLNQRIIPPVSDEYRFERYFVSTSNILGILALNILIVNRTIVTAITFRSKMEAVAGVFGERSHESL